MSNHNDIKDVLEEYIVVRINLGIPSVIIDYILEKKRENVCVKLGDNYYQILKLFHQGGMSNVYIAEDIFNNIKVVIKCDKSKRNFSQIEYDVMEFFKDNDNFVKCYHADIKKNILVMEHVECYDLFEYYILLNSMIEEEKKDDINYENLCINGILPFDKLIDILIQIAKAILCMHVNSYAHNDIKLENILIDKNEKIKLCDFGFTTKIVGDKITRNTGAGTREYAAPELHNSKRYDHTKSDVWQFGCIMYIFTHNAYPFLKNSFDDYNEGMFNRQVRNAILNCEKTLCVHYYCYNCGDIPLIFNKLNRSIFKIDPKERPNMQTVLDELITIKNTYQNINS